MNKFNKTIAALFFFAALVSAAGTAFAQVTANEFAGTSGASWMKLGVSARAAAMGDSYTAICDDASAMFWNPAKLSGVRKMQFVMQYGMWFANMGYHAFGISIPLNKKPAAAVTTDTASATPATTAAPAEDRYSSYFSRYSYPYGRYPGYSSYGQDEEKEEVLPPGGAIGVGIKYFDYGSMPTLDEFGVEGELFPANGYCATVSYANVLGEVLGLGASVKYVTETIDDVVTSAFSGDAGLSLTLGGLGYSGNGICLSAVMQNAGGALSAGSPTGESPLPPITRAGVGIKLAAITISGDYVMQTDHESKMSAGFEFMLGTIALRAGYVIGNDDMKGDALLSGLSAGVGLRSQDISLDAAVVPYGALGYDIRVSLSFTFK